MTDGTSEDTKRKPGRPKGAELTKKVHIPMSYALFEELQQLRTETGAPSVAALIRSALKQYEFLFDAQKAGAEIIIRRQNGEYEEKVKFIP